MRRNRPAILRRLPLGLVLAGIAFAATACASDNEPQTVLNPQGEVARQLDRLWNPVFIIATVVFFLVQGMVILFAIKYRAKSDDDAPVQTHGNTVLEVAWTAAPALLLVGIGFFTVATLIDLDRMPEGPDVVHVHITGHQWWWEYEYPDYGVITANELHIPADTDIRVTLTASDVIHSWWPPALAGKVDAIPGRINHLKLHADHPNRTYLGQCTEYCGLSHANMRIRVVTHTRDGFEQWIREQRAPAAATTGEGADLFVVKGCGGCHAVRGLTEGRVGPDLTHLYSRTHFAGAMFEINEANMRRWLRNPPAEKPMDPDHGMGMPNLNLTEDEITTLMRFLETLR